MLPIAYRFNSSLSALIKQVDGKIPKSIMN
jgi:hypothetical protein